MQHYTTIEQSKHLLELGLNSETADMEYMFFRGDGGLVSTVPFIKEEPDLTERGENRAYNFIPCWSLSALLEIIPYYHIHAPYLYESNYICYSTHPDLIDAEFSGKTSIEAAYNMVCYLLTNGYIKKGE